MSVPVELPALAEVMARYSFVYLLTGSAHRAPHAVTVVPILEGGVLVVDGVGLRTRQPCWRVPTWASSGRHSRCRNTR